ncbi:MAG: flagellar hook protein FlgE [Candidimonas sp.]|nr:MAG: flagellar hook protein FlgE [Candidimonas sp.]
MSFSQGLSGLSAAGQDLDVIGNNISNSSTVGFKSSSISFADVYANANIGIGVRVASVNQNFSTGSVTNTGNEYDMAIDGQNGLFRLVDTNGNILYSRNGQFHKDENNNIVNSTGQILTGYIGGPSSTTLGPLTVPQVNIPPSATANITLATNLDANAPLISAAGRAEVLGSVTLTPTLTGVPNPQAYYTVSSSGAYSWVDSAGNPVAAPADGTYTSGAGVPVTLAGGQITSGSFDTTVAPDTTYVSPLPATPFNPNNPDSYTHPLPISVYDSLGNPHQLTAYFVKTADDPGLSNAWNLYYQMDGRPVDIPAGGGPAVLTFDSAGNLTSNPKITIGVTQPGTTASPAAPLTVTMNLAGTTQYGGGFSPNFVTDGYPTGEFSNVTIGSDGKITANYTNGETQALGYVALANFNNMEGLKPAGDSAWMESATSGQPILGRPGTNGLATLKGQAVEASNVDLSQELVNMIIAQRTYQANAQAIKTQDQVMQSLIQMN